MPDYHTRQKKIQKNLESILYELQKNEEQFWNLAEAMPSVVVIINPLGKITYVNKRIIEVFGYTPDELIGYSVDMLLPENLRNVHIAHRAGYFEKPSNRSMGKGQELVACRKDGSIFPVEIGLGYLTTYNETEAIAFIVDISERKQMQDALQESERLLKKSQAMAHIGSWEVNLQTSETNWSDEFFRICGLEPQSIIPTPDIGFSIIHPDDRERAAQAFEDTQKTNIPYKIEKRIVRPSGEIRWVTSQGEVTEDEISGAQWLSGVFIDITDRKLAEEHVLQLKLEKERLTLLSNFIQNVSHEFRTPLSIINSSAHLMAHSDNEQARLNKAAVIQQQVDQTSHLIEMLMTMVKLETLNTLTLAPLSIASSIEAVCQSLRKLYNNAPSLNYNYPNNLPTILGNGDYLFKAFRQILDNAHRFTPEDGTITITVEPVDDYLRVTCQDTGHGIAENDLPHIFTSFWRHDIAHTTPGFGLGLTMAKKIIELHRGTITVESAVGEGCTVHVMLPIFD